MGAGITQVLCMNRRDLTMEWFLQTLEPLLKAPHIIVQLGHAYPTPESVFSMQAQLFTGSSAFLHTTLGKMQEAIETQCPYES